MSLSATNGLGVQRHCRHVGSPAHCSGADQRLPVSGDSTHCIVAPLDGRDSATTNRLHSAPRHGEPATWLYIETRREQQIGVEKECLARHARCQPQHKRFRLAPFGASRQAPSEEKTQGETRPRNARIASHRPGVSGRLCMVDTGSVQELVPIGLIGIHNPWGIPSAPRQQRRSAVSRRGRGGAQATRRIVARDTNMTPRFRCWRALAHKNGGIILRP